MRYEYTEIFRLKRMLEDAKIQFEYIDNSIVSGLEHYQIIVRKSSDEINELEEFQGLDEYEDLTRIVSVIQGYGTYGADLDLLEIRGLLTEEELKEDSVVGYLTAEEVFNRIIVSLED